MMKQYNRVCARIDLDAIDLLEGIGTEDPVRMYLKEIGGKSRKDRIYVTFEKY